MKRVAVLDDDESLIDLYRTILEEDGYTMQAVAFTRDLNVLLNNIRGCHSNMLILDVHLPGLGSFEIMQGMLADRELRHLPILICSASRPSLNALQDLMRGVGHKMPLTLEKPFDLDDLTDCIRTLIGKP